MIWNFHPLSGTYVHCKPNFKSIYLFPSLSYELSKLVNWKTPFHKAGHIWYPNEDTIILNYIGLLLTWVNRLLHQLECANLYIYHNIQQSTAIVYLWWYNIIVLLMNAYIYRVKIFASFGYIFLQFTTQYLYPNQLLSWQLLQTTPAFVSTVGNKLSIMNNILEWSVLVFQWSVCLAVENIFLVLRCYSIVNNVKTQQGSYLNNNINSLSLALQ